MEKDNLLRELSQYGDVEIWSEEPNFSFLIIGAGLDEPKTLLKIEKIISEYAKINGYCFPEMIKGPNNFINITLKTLI